MLCYMYEWGPYVYVENIFLVHIQNAHSTLPAVRPPKRRDSVRRVLAGFRLCTLFCMPLADFEYMYSIYCSFGSSGHEHRRNDEL